MHARNWAVAWRAKRSPTPIEYFPKVIMRLNDSSLPVTIGIVLARGQNFSGDSPGGRIRPRARRRRAVGLQPANLLQTARLAVSSVGLNEIGRRVLTRRFHVLI
jgi:hypothetical protein